MLRYRLDFQSWLRRQTALQTVKNTIIKEPLVHLYSKPTRTLVSVILLTHCVLAITRGEIKFIHRVRKKGATLFSTITLAFLSRFLPFFH